MRPFGTTIFAEMSALAVRTGAVNLGQGFPDTDGPAGDARRGRRGAARRGAQPVPARPRHPGAARRDRRAPAGRSGASTTTRTARSSSRPAPPRRSRPASSALCETGDEVVCFEPYYDSYAASIALAGAVRRPVTLRRARTGGYGFDPAELRAAFGPRTRLVLLNSPHNPTGKVLHPRRAGADRRALPGARPVAVTDEVYEHLVFTTPSRRTCRWRRCPGMRDRTLQISSAGQDLLLHRLEDRLGLRPRAAGVARCCGSSSSSPSSTRGPLQPAVACALDCPTSVLRRLPRRPAGASATACATG